MSLALYLDVSWVDPDFYWPDYYPRLEGELISMLEKQNIDPSMAFFRSFSVSRKKLVLQKGTDRDAQSKYRDEVLEEKMGIGPAQYTWAVKIPSFIIYAPVSFVEGENAIAVYDAEKMYYAPIFLFHDALLFKCNPKEALLAVIEPKNYRKSSEEHD